MSITGALHKTGLWIGAIVGGIADGLGIEPVPASRTVAMVRVLTALPIGIAEGISDADRALAARREAVRRGR